MATRLQEEAAIKLKFGGGIHSRAAEDDIRDDECFDGENFELDIERSDFRKRPSFDLIGTLPNGSEVRGFVTLQKSDGTISTLIQGGSQVYEWDGETTFTNVGTVNSAARLRGKIEHNFLLDDIVLITDLNLQEEVFQWDGTTLSEVNFVDEADASFGTFRAKYCTVSNERVIFANIYDNGTTFPHLIIGSESGDYNQITVSNRPSSSLGDADPFFLVEPDYRPINGLVQGFGTILTSSESGSIYTLKGSTAKDFSFDGFFRRSAASGDEAVVDIGNDILYGRMGRIESVRDTDRVGDSENNDLSMGIYDKIKSYDNWTSVYNQRTQKVYFFPDSQPECWVYDKPIGERKEKSPWSKYTTNHPLSFTPSAVMNCYDPSDGLEYVLMGDTSGNVYRMEGTGNNGDGGTTAVSATRLSKLFSAPLDARNYQMEGYVKYRRTNPQTLTLKFECAGEEVFNQEITVNLDVDLEGSYYNSGIYYGNGEYYNSLFAGKLTRTNYILPGRANEFQIRTTIESSSDWQINEILARVYQAS